MYLVFEDTSSLIEFIELPQYLYEAGWASEGNVVACTQPRRVAATSVAGRVATEVGSILGDEAGRSFWFHDGIIDSCSGRLYHQIRRRQRQGAHTYPLLDRWDAHPRDLD